MMSFKNLLALLLLLNLALACNQNSSPEVVTVATAASEASTDEIQGELVKTEFTIKGMTCEIGCARTIENNLDNTAGVSYAKVDFEKELAMVEYDNARVNTELLESKISGLSETYKVENVKEVEAFSQTAKGCKKDCNMACCKGEKSEDCPPDCKKACCAEKQTDS